MTMRDLREIRKLLTSFDPAGAQASGDPGPATHSAHYPPGGCRPARSRLRSRRLTFAIGAGVSMALAAALGVSSVFTSDTGAPSRAVAAPRLLSFERENSAVSARGVLQAAAASAGRQPDRTGSGRYLYVESKGWYLLTRVSGQTSHSSIVPVVTQQWTAADGSGRIKKTPLTASDASGPGSDDSYGPGQLNLIWPPDSMSSDPKVLRTQLMEGHPADLGNAEVLAAISDLYLEQPVRPATAAAILKVLAELDGIRYDGTVTDRSGRHGIAVSLDSDISGLPTRYFLVFDQTTGQLLDSEQVLTKTAGRLGVPIPSVIAYTIYLRAYHTDKLG